MPPKSRAQLLVGLVGYVLMCIFFVSLALGSLRLAVDDLQKYQHLQRVGQQTNARILELTPLLIRSGGDLTYQFEIKEPDGSVQTYIDKGHVFGPRYSQLVNKSEVLVDYDPANPKLSRISESYEFVDGLMNFAPAIVGIAILLSPVFFGISYRLRQHIHHAQSPQDYRYRRVV